jgi:ParB family chromosome partitioning protein
MSDEEVLTVLSLIMARTLAADSPIVEALLHVLSVDLSGYWAPDEPFFELLRDKQVINTLLAEVSSDDTAKTMLSETGRAQKDKLTAEAAPDWRPGWMQVPPKSVLDGAKQGPVAQWDRISGVFEDEEPACTGTSNSDNIAA